VLLLNHVTVFIRKPVKTTAARKKKSCVNARRLNKGDR
jgi:hypothetical protein